MKSLLFFCLLSLASCAFYKLQTAILENDVSSVHELCSNYIFTSKQVKQGLGMIFVKEYPKAEEFQLVKDLLNGAEKCATGLLNLSSTFRKYISSLSPEELAKLDTPTCSARKWALASGSPVDHRTLPDDKQSDLTYLKWAASTSFGNYDCIRRCFVMKENERYPWMDRYGFLNASLLIGLLRKGFLKNAATIANMFYYEPSEEFLSELRVEHGRKYMEDVKKMLAQTNQQYNLHKDIIHGNMDRLSRCLLSSNSCYYSRIDGSNLFHHLFSFALEISLYDHDSFREVFEQALAMLDDLLKEPRAFKAACRRYGGNYPSYEAVNADCLQLVRVLAINGVPMNQSNSKRTGTPLHTAIAQKHRSISHFLLREYRGPLALNTPSTFCDGNNGMIIPGFTPLHIAVFLDEMLTVWDLLAKGASPDSISQGIVQSRNVSQMLTVWHFFPIFLLFQDLSFLPHELVDVFREHIIPYLGSAEFLDKK